MTDQRRTRQLTVTSVADGKTEHRDLSALTLTELLQTVGVVAADLNLLAAMAAGGAGLVKVAKVALAGTANTAGGLGGWTNPESGAILIEKVLVDVTTIAAAACLIDVGSQATGLTTLSDNLLDGIDVHSATGVLAIADQAGANGKTRQKLAAGKFVTFSTQTGGSDAASGLVGNAFIFYVLA